jgi:hypothetical protein
MDPKIANRDLRPPPQPGLPRGLLLAITLIHVVVIAALVGGIQWKRGAPADATLEERASVRSSRRQAPAPLTELDQTASSANGASPTGAQPRTACPSRPLLAAAGGKDGQVTVPASVTGKTGKDIDALLVAGKEAAAAGQARDAEVAYLTSCRVADAFKGTGSIESANARYQLARHYVEVAGGASAAPMGQRAEILRQAQAFYADSLQRFRAQWGDSHEKTRFAAAGLEAARMALLETTPPAAGSAAVVSAPRMAAPGAARPAPGRQPAAEPPRQAPTRTQARSRNASSRNAVAESAPSRAAAPKPSFDCGKARSFAERTICSDAELAQLDRDLGRLYARAKLAAADPAAFRRRSDAEWRRREQTCRDRSCLVRWYAERRQQLTDFLGQASLQADRTAAR